MIDFIKKYKAFGIGILITLILVVVLQYTGFINVKGGLWLENIVFFTFWSLVFSFPIYKFAYLKEQKHAVFKVLGLIVLLVLTIIYDSTVRIPDNPLTIILITAFWIGISYVLLPKFFGKYKYPIIGVYALILTYFSFVRLASASFEEYATNSKEMVMILLIIPIPIFGLVWMYEQWKWVKSLQSAKTNAELELLRTQINPHFFFNTLNNLYSLTVKHSDKAPEVVLKLSEMMRYTIYEGKKESVFLKDEVDYLNNYIDLHKIRYKKEVDIQFTYNIDESEEIAPLLYIILLENAIKHGVESLSEDAFIKMDLTSEHGQVKFTISNNFERVERLEQQGIGLENLKRRLGLIYAKKHTLVISEEESVYKAELTIDQK